METGVDRSGRFGKWLENLQDWNLEPQPLLGYSPAYLAHENGAEEICIESVEMLYDEIEKPCQAGVMASNPLKEKGFVPWRLFEDKL